MIIDHDTIKVVEELGIKSFKLPSRAFPKILSQNHHR